MNHESTTPPQRLLELADYLERALARIYISVTINAILIAAAGALFVFIMLGWSAFSMLQAIGFLFLGLLVGMGLLRYGKRKKYREFENLLNADKLTLEEFSEFIRSNPIEYAMCFALLNDKMFKTDEADNPKIK